MKRKILSGFILILVVISIVAVANIEVSTRQGINYVVKTKKIPLFYKVLGYIYRHLAYKQIVREIIKDARSDEEKVLRIFNWTSQQIRRNIPEDYPIVDDHVLNIIIRGYGTTDQSQDVFVTLCNYAGVAATWILTSPNNSKNFLALSLVKLDDEWKIFDSYFGYYFINKQGQIASIDDLVNDLTLVEQIKKAPVYHKIEYKRYFEGLRKIDKSKLDISRFRQQMPGYRLLYEAKNLFKGELNDNNRRER